MMFIRGCGHKDSTYAISRFRWECPWCETDQRNAALAKVAPYPANGQTIIPNPLAQRQQP